METGENPDAKLSRRAWEVAKARGPWTLKASALAVALVFGVRAVACDHTNTGPVDFRFHGNHCGPGHGTDGEAMDALDEACRDHDREVP